MDPGLLSLNFLYESAPFPSCHAASLVESDRGSLLCAFFGGTHERHPDVCIYLCRWDGKTWSEPVNIADGVIEEVILATSFTAEGEATAHVITQALAARGIKVTRLARGVPVGSELEYVDLSTIAHALSDRR